MLQREVQVHRWLCAVLVVRWNEVEVVKMELKLVRHLYQSHELLFVLFKEGPVEVTTLKHAFGRRRLPDDTEGGESWQNISATNSSTSLIQPVN